MTDEEITSGRALIAKLQEEQHQAKLQRVVDGRWIDPAFEKIYTDYADQCDKIVKDFRAEYFPDIDTLTATQAAMLPRTAEDHAMLAAKLRMRLEPYYRQMTELKSRYWTPTIIVEH
jgi:hypothetical protein